MIEPHMATMLAFLLTDAAADGPWLRAALADAVDTSFNALTVDGDTSTSDMVVLLASGAAGNGRLDRRHPDGSGFGEALGRLCRDLARQVVRDGEGATRVLTVTVRGARNREEARTAARGIARSNLFKAALSGARPAWGFAVAALGAAGVAPTMERFGVHFGEVELVRSGIHRGPEADAAARRHLAGTDPAMTVDLGRGRAAFTYTTCDLSAEYVAINATPAVPDPTPRLS